MKRYLPLLAAFCAAICLISAPFVGALAGYEDGCVTLQTEKKTLRFSKAQTAQVRLHISI